MVMVCALKWSQKEQNKGPWRKYFFFGISTYVEASVGASRQRMNVLWLTAYVCSLNPSTQTHPLYATLPTTTPTPSQSIRGLTLFCTWMTARCLKYFPVCSRINCSSGNDDSSYKKEEKNRKMSKKSLTTKTEKLSTEACFVFDVLSLFIFSFLSVLVSRRNMLKILTKCFDCHIIRNGFPFPTSFISVWYFDLWMNAIFAAQATHFYAI